MKSILIIEDDIDLREALQTKLVSEGYDVRTTETSQHGLQLVTERVPDLILLDVLTNSLHASEFLRELRDVDNPGNKCTVIVFTNLDNEQLRAKLMEYDIAAYLVKAKTSLEVLADKVKGLFEVQPIKQMEP